MLTSNMMRFLSLLLLGVCACVVSVVMCSSLICLRGCDCDACTVVCVACVYAERVRGCDDDAMLVWRTGGCIVVVVTAGCEYMGLTRGSGLMSTADNVLDECGVWDDKC